MIISVHFTFMDLVSTVFRNRCERASHISQSSKFIYMHSIYGEGCLCQQRQQFWVKIAYYYILHVTNELNTQSCVFLLDYNSQESPLPTLSHFFSGNGASLYSQPGLSSPLASDLTMCSLISRSLNTISLYSLEVGVVHRDVSEAVRAVQDVVAVAHLRQDTLYITGLSLAETDRVPKTLASY